jgi:hypothetical protein
MKTILLDESKLKEKIHTMEALRDVHSNTSAEYIDIDNQIQFALDLISVCTIKEKSLTEKEN